MQDFLTLIAGRRIPHLDPETVADQIIRFVAGRNILRHAAYLYLLHYLIEKRKILELEPEYHFELRMLTSALFYAILVSCAAELEYFPSHVYFVFKKGGRKKVCGCIRIELPQNPASLFQVLRFECDKVEEKCLRRALEWLNEHLQERIDFELLETVLRALLSAMNCSFVSPARPQLFKAYVRCSNRYFGFCEDPEGFLENAERVFRNFKWEWGFGGQFWARVARTGLEYLRGQLSPLLFIDTCLHLQHAFGLFLDRFTDYDLELLELLDAIRDGDWERILPYAEELNPRIRKYIREISP